MTKYAETPDRLAGLEVYAVRFAVWGIVATPGRRSCGCTAPRAPLAGAGRRGHKARWSEHRPDATGPPDDVQPLNSIHAPGLGELRVPWVASDLGRSSVDRGLVAIAGGLRLRGFAVEELGHVEFAAAESHQDSPNSGPPFDVVLNLAHRGRDALDEREQRIVFAAGERVGEDRLGLGLHAM